MRNQRTISQTGQVAAFTQVGDLRTVTITASEAAWPSLAGPIPSTVTVRGSSQPLGSWLCPTSASAAGRSAMSTKSIR
jgi:hypothetical protein